MQRIDVFGLPSEDGEPNQGGEEKPLLAARAASAPDAEESAVPEPERS